MNTLTKDSSGWPTPMLLLPQAIWLTHSYSIMKLNYRCNKQRIIVTLYFVILNIAIVTLAPLARFRCTVDRVPV